MKITKYQNVYYYTWFFDVEDIPEKCLEAAARVDKLFDGDHERFVVVVDYDNENDAIDDICLIYATHEYDEIGLDYEFTEEEINYMLDCIRKDLNK